MFYYSTYKAPQIWPVHHYLCIVVRSAADTLEATEELLCNGSESKLLSSVSFLPAYCLQLGFIKAVILFW